MRVELRALQVCCHPALIKAMVHEGEVEGMEEAADPEADLLTKMTDMTLKAEEEASGYNFFCWFCRTLQCCFLLVHC